MNWFIFSRPITVAFSSSFSMPTCPTGKNASNACKPMLMESRGKTRRNHLLLVRKDLGQQRLERAHFLLHLLNRALMQDQPCLHFICRPGTTPPPFQPMRMETQSVPNCTRFIRAEGGQEVKKGGKIRWIVRMQRDHPKVADTLFGEEFIALFLVFGTKPELSLPHDEFSLQ